ncbi:MAG: TIGR04283 family arsenosugar biosynthesis glycosyltransferase [Saprospiraceae bacterium]
MKVSIIVPTLNEAVNIARVVKQLKANCNGSLAELLVVDGGSTDETLKIAEHAGAIALQAPMRGRAQQMNFGAHHATGEVLYFVHGDTVPPCSYMDDVLEAVAEGFPIGCFRFRFESSHPLLRINAYMTRFNYLWCRGGDQTLFVTRQVFNELGGYREDHIIMEEFDFIRRAQARYPFKIIPKEVLVSARKYDKNGYLRVQLANLIVFNMFRLGFPQQSLAQTYRRLLNY